MSVRVYVEVSMRSGGECVVYVEVSVRSVGGGEYE